MSRYFDPISMQLGKRAPDSFAAALGRSFRETGFAVITDHGLDEAVIQEAVAATKAFFALPAPAKLGYFDTEGGGQRGYTPFGTENAKGRQYADLKEFWHTGRLGMETTPLAPLMPPTPSVSEIPAFDVCTRNLFEALDMLGRDLLSAIAIDLGLPVDWFNAKVEHGNSILRLLHYPAQTESPAPGSVRAAPHEDINLITLLLGAEEAGLEVKHRSGDWLAVNPPAGALVVNVGDMLSRLTQNVLPSTTHRVVNPSKARASHARYSTPFFLHFAPDILIEPLESCDQQGQARPANITAQDYLMERLREIGLVKD
ncbi:MAG: 2-oxoglutarate and iron-dependent oxygenase domain-containing protein [Hyphomonadaceae bacterium]